MSTLNDKPAAGDIWQSSSRYAHQEVLKNWLAFSILDENRASAGSVSG
jgi:hypothetical protein